MYVCVRAYSTSGLIVETCKLLNQGSEQNAYKTTVYDFDANSVDWEEIKTVPIPITRKYCAMKSLYVQANIASANQYLMHVYKNDIILVL